LVGFERFVATPLSFYYTPKAQGIGFGPRPRQANMPFSVPLIDGIVGETGAVPGRPLEVPDLCSWFAFAQWSHYGLP